MAVITAHIDCRYCHRDTVLRLDHEAFHKWQDGMFIQDAFPELSTTNRETLLSATCRRCQDSIFDEDD